jgi:hypothetical protein
MRAISRLKGAHCPPPHLPLLIEKIRIANAVWHRSNGLLAGFRSAEA